MHEKSGMTVVNFAHRSQFCILPTQVKVDTDDIR